MPNDCDHECACCQAEPSGRETRASNTLTIEPPRRCAAALSFEEDGMTRESAVRHASEGSYGMPGVLAEAIVGLFGRDETAWLLLAETLCWIDELPDALPKRLHASAED